MAASLSFQQAVTSGAAASTLAFTCASAAGQERLVALCGIAQSSIASSGFTSVTIDGQAATQVGSTVRTTDPGSNGPIVAFFRAAGTSGTSINVAFTKVGTFFDTRGALWTLSDASTLLASNTASVNGVIGGSFPGAASLNLNTITNGAAAAVTLVYDSSSHDITWTGLTERADATTSLYGGDWFSVADLNVGSTSAPLTVSAATPLTTFTVNSAQSALAVSFNSAAPVVHYPFDDTTTTDASGNGNTGILTGTGTTLVTGKIGSGALSFNGSGHVTFTSVAALGLATATSEFSAACWVKTSQSSDCSILCLRNSGNNKPAIELVIGYNGYDNAFTGKPSCVIRDNAGVGTTVVNAASAINNNAWHHVAITRTSGQLLTLYVDGASSATATDTLANAMTPNLAGSAIAYEAYGGYWHLTGSLDDFRIYNRALTSTEVAALYAAGTPSGTTLTAAAGSYALTGTAAALTHNQTAAAGSYAITGTAASLALRQTAAAGAYTLTGTAATFVTPFVLPAVAGAYTITGTAATLAYTDNVTFAAAAGAYAYTGTAAAFQVGGNVVIATDPGAYVLTGTAATFATTSNVVLAAAAGAYALTGSAATFATSTVLAAAAGAYALTGTAATFATTSNVTFFCGSGAYTLTGSPAAFLGAELPPEPTPPPGAGGYAGALYRPYRLRKKRKEDEEPPEPVYPPDLPPPPMPASPPDLPPPPLHALIDLMPPPQVPAPRPTQPAKPNVNKPAVADDDDDEAVELILKLLS